MENECLAKRFKGNVINDNSSTTAESNKIVENPADDSNSCSSNVSNLLTEADKALQELNKRHVKPTVEEAKLGIEIFIGDTKDQFHGLIKTRYADFVVHEIDLDGKVAKLTDLEPPVEEEIGNALKLEDLFERKVLVCLSNVNNGQLDCYKIDVTGMDKDTRTSIHHAIRESYDRLESSTVSGNEQDFIKNKSDKKITSDNKEKPKEIISEESSTVDKERIDESKDIIIEQSESSERLVKKDENKYILVTRRNKSSRHRSIWPRGRPDYTRFVLYKENKDTMDAIHNLAVATNSKPSVFTYAGTKDRRAITSQWVTGWRVDPRRLIGSMRRFNKRPFLKVGNFTFHKEPIRLGQLKANRFDLVIRHLVHNSGGMQVIENSVESIKQNGFINYFGIQRFGTRTIQTHEIGLAILQSRWDKAIDLILSYRFDENTSQDANVSSTNQDNNNESSKQLNPPETEGQKPTGHHGKFWARGAEQHNACIDLWKSKQDAELVFKKFPHFRITNEGLIIKALSKATSNGPNPDLSGAISSLPRNTRSMYVHSYQSLLWNKITTYRLKKHGYKVIIGDLVLPPETKISDSSLDMLTSIDESGENHDSVRQEESEKGSSVDNQHDVKNSQDLKLTKKNDLMDDIHSTIVTVTEENLDRYTIFDVVLPLPGSRVKIPTNDVADELNRLLKVDELTLESFRAREKIFVSYGSYRKILVKPANITWSIQQYSNPRENLIETDLEQLDRDFSDTNNEINDETRSPSKTDFCDEALVISLDLPPSSYATMCLRELMKKPSTDFNSRF